MALAFSTALLVELRPVADARSKGAYLAQLWQAPNDIAERDLFFGPGGRARVPAPDGTFAFVARKTSGTNPGYDVQDGRGGEWSVKLDEEAQTEVVVSRILWAIGFHQPATYYVARWTMTGRDAGPQPPGRFRFEPPESKVVGAWSWYDNPFVGTRPYGGLIVAQLVFNNWDLKTPNNKIYEPLHAGAPGRSYVVRDLGASLGSARQFRLLTWLHVRNKQGTKNDLEAFERQGFITGVDGERVDFDYSGLDGRLLRGVVLADVRWLCGWLARLSDKQWDDAFRAAEYDPETRDRYIRKIKEKIAEGLTVSSAP
jgi:hypothetical protein